MFGQGPALGGQIVVCGALMCGMTFGKDGCR